jgi:hypothetical protein
VNNEDYNDEDWPYDPLKKTREMRSLMMRREKIT